MKFESRTAASAAVFGLASLSKVYKGYKLYEDAHGAWDGFATTGRLPADVAASLGSKAYPKPPTPSVRGVSAPHTTPQHVQLHNNCNVSPLISQSPLTPLRGHSVVARLD